MPEVAGQNLAPSALNNVLNATFGDSASALAAGWSSIHDTMVWYEDYNSENDLWQKDGSDYSSEPDLFLPMAAALSPGQRAALDFILLSSLVKIGFGTTEAIEEMRDDVDEIFDGAETLSVYSGINRGIFRGGVAITSQALMEQNMGKGYCCNVDSFPKSR